MAEPSVQLQKEPADIIVKGFSNFISEDSDKFKPESGRYHLYISYACPFASRAFMVRQLKGLEDHIGLSVVHPTYQKTKPDVDDHIGWVFRKEDDEPLQSPLGYGSFSCKGCIPDTVNNAKTIRELYEMSNAVVKKFSVPVLWDKKNKEIVSCESADIVRIFNSAFNAFAKNPELDLYPEPLRKKIDEINEWVFNDITSGVYKAGFAEKQEAYEEAFNNLFKSLDRAEEILSESRYLCGDQLTEADIKLFASLVRFDEVYYLHLKCNKKRIVDYPNLLNYCREIYQIPEITGTVNMDHIKVAYYSCMPKINHYAIVPIGPNFMATLKEKHNRG